MTTPAKPRKTGAGKSAARTWLVRGVIGLLIGGVLGAGAGVFTVNRLEPGRGNGVDSLQVMLDSIAKGNIATDSGVKTPAAPAASQPDTAAATVDSVPVPTVTDLEEGAARNAIRDAGLQVGEVVFQANTKPAGTVLGSTPAAGTFVARGSAVSLTLSDGRPPTDTFPDAHSRSRP